MPRVKQSNDGFDIYAVNTDGNRRLVDVSDPLHRLILERLSDGPMSTTEISDMSKKAQSTLSVHLEQMVNQNLIASEYDSNDSRRKLFRLTSVRVASSKQVSEEGSDEAKSFLSTSVRGDDFHRYLLKAVLMSAESNGMDICPMMNILGSQLAMKMVPKVGSDKVENIIRFLQEFYERNGLGEVCIYTFLPLTIIIRDIEETQCRFEAFAAFSHGLFSTLLSQIIGRKYRISKSEIFGTGNNYYKFVIDLA